MVSVELGKVYRDRASGFTGTATGIAEYLDDTGSVRLTAETGPTKAVVHEWFPPGRLIEAESKSTGFKS